MGSAVGSATVGSIAGASGDAGVEYRRAVAAFAVAAGAVGAPLLGFGVPAAHASVSAVALETDDPVDDIRIEFSHGHTAFVQAKRALRRGKPLTEAVAQWVAAARAGLDPEKHRLVIVAGSLTGTMEQLRTVLDRERTDQPGAPTAPERKILEHVKSLLGELDDPVRESVLRCAHVVGLAVEEPDSNGAQLAVQRLTSIVASSQPPDALEAWQRLTAVAGRVARLRGGYRIDSWLRELRGAGVDLSEQGDLPAARAERREAALDRYRERLRRDAETMDLRSLGAELPPLPIERADGVVKVSRARDGDRGSGRLLWAFLRRGRAVLTGLPGGGKSTALRMLAAELSDLQDGSVPIRVSLRDVELQDASRGFRERVLAVAVRDVPQRNRQLLSAHLDELLDTGGAVLLLDSLDETYDRRGDVVADIERLMADVSPDTDVLLATRDIAYGHAATLGWPELRLLAPEDPIKTANAVLEHAAEQPARTASDQPAAACVQQQSAWVSDALAKDKTLRETPLMPVLLAILAIELPSHALPRGRARILAAVVDLAVRRHELKRNSKPLGRLAGTQRATLTHYVFERASSALLDAGGKMPQGALVAKIAEDLAGHFDLSAGDADATATDALRFFDESGVFVASGADALVVPRIALFAEIGDALEVARAPDTLLGWVRQRAGQAQLEPLVLAAAMSAEAAQAMADVAHESADRALLHAVVRAHSEGAHLDQERLRRLVSDLAADVETGTPESWDSWELIQTLPFDSDRDEELKRATREHPEPHQTLAAAQLALRFRSREELLVDPDALLAVLRVRSLPRRAPARRDGILDLRDLTKDSELQSVQVAAAQILLGAVDEATESVVSLASTGGSGRRKELGELLRQRGFDAEAAAAAEDLTPLRGYAAKWLAGYDPGAARRLLESLARLDQVPLTRLQMTRLDELADLVETLDLNDASSRYMLEEPEEAAAVVTLVAALYSFDLRVVAAQAAVVLDRMGPDDDHAPYYALFDGARARTDPAWGNVEDIPAAVELLGRVFTWGRAHAYVAARALWQQPLAAPAAVPMLRELLPRLEPSTDHQRVAAFALCSLVDGPEPMCWQDSGNPVLRGVLAHVCPPGADGQQSEILGRCLRDMDGYVRLEAMRRAAQLRVVGLQRVLSDAANQPYEWTCLSCRTLNPPGTRSCTTDGCRRVGPDLARAADTLVADPDSADEND